MRQEKFDNNIDFINLCSKIMHVQLYEQICMTSLNIKLLFRYGILGKIHGTLWDITIRR